MCLRGMMGMFLPRREVVKGGRRGWRWGVDGEVVAEG